MIWESIAPGEVSWCNGRDSDLGRPNEAMEQSLRHRPYDWVTTHVLAQ
jgi:hypothetical protein